MDVIALLEKISVPRPNRSEQDSMARVDPENLKLMVRVLERIIDGFR